MNKWVPYLLFIPNHFFFFRLLDEVLVKLDSCLGIWFRSFSGVFCVCVFSATLWANLFYF